MKHEELILKAAKSSGYKDESIWKMSIGETRSLI